VGPAVASRRAGRVTQRTRAEREKEKQLWSLLPGVEGETSQPVWMIAWNFGPVWFPIWASPPNKENALNPWAAKE